MTDFVVSIEGADQMAGFNTYMRRICPVTLLDDGLHFQYEVQGYTPRNWLGAIFRYIDERRGHVVATGTIDGVAFAYDGEFVNRLSNFQVELAAVGCDSYPLQVAFAGFGRGLVIDSNPPQYAVASATVRDLSTFLRGLGSRILNPMLGAFTLNATAPDFQLSGVLLPGFIRLRRGELVPRCEPHPLLQTGSKRAVKAYDRLTSSRWEAARKHRKFMALRTEQRAHPGCALMQLHVISEAKPFAGGCLWKTRACSGCTGGPREACKDYLLNGTPLPERVHGLCNYASQFHPGPADIKAGDILIQLEA